MKIAVEMKETLTRVVIVEAEDYLEAEKKVLDAYKRGILELCADNSVVDLELKDYTEEYAGVLGDEFKTLEVTRIV